MFYARKTDGAFPKINGLARKGSRLISFPTLVMHVLDLQSVLPLSFL